MKIRFALDLETTNHEDGSVEITAFCSTAKGDRYGTTEVISGDQLNHVRSRENCIEYVTQRVLADAIVGAYGATRV